MASSTERATPAARASAGHLGSMPFGQVLFELLEAEDTGTLLLYGEDDALHAAVRVEAGRPTAALAEDEGEHNLATLLLPLFGWTEGRFEFVAGDDLVGEHAVLHGRLDPIPLITAGARGSMRDVWIERSMSRIERSLVQKTHRIEQSRYGFTAEELQVLAALDGGRLELDEIRTQAGVRENVLRRVLYVLLLTRGISLVPKQRTASGTITRSQRVPAAAAATATAAATPAVSQPAPAASEPSSPQQWTAQVIDGDWLLPAEQTPAAAPTRTRPPAPAARASTPAARQAPAAASPGPSPSRSPSRSAVPSPSPVPSPSRSPSRGPVPSPSPSRNPSRGPSPSRSVTQSGSVQPNRPLTAYSLRPGSLPPDADARTRREYAEAQWRKAEALARRGEFEHALEVARAAVKLTQPSPEHDAMLGWLILQHAGGAEHVHQHVFRCIDRAFKRDPLCEQVLYYKGLVHALLGDTEQAQAHFQRVLMVNPNHADAMREVRIYEMRKDHARTETSFLRRLLTGRPKTE